MKKSLLFVVTAILTVSLVLGACTPQAELTPEATEALEVEETEVVASEETAEAEVKEDIVVGVSVAAMDQAMQMVLGVMGQEAEKAGVEIVSTSAENDITKQISDIETLITREVDVILVRPMDADALIPVIEAATAAGIPTLAFGGVGVNSDKLTVNLVFSQYEGATRQGDAIAQMLDENPEVVLKVGYIWGWKGTAGLEGRYSGIFDTLAPYVESGRVVILDEQEAKFDTNEAMTVVENWIQKYPEMNTIMAMTDGMGIGAVNVLKAANVDFDEWYIYSHDLRELADFIRDGTVEGSVYNNMIELSKRAFHLGLQLAQGEQLPPVVDVGVEEGLFVYVTKDNIDEVLPKQ